eukprot:CAMPEP_0116567038 /NCGR_PEP_ID=MMETSP0397-20121206/14781_1 /TAXON_ID=216820 /ORGANISM="Cyclophora tenuis, Strain ECT3854" /LENGTH=109 /DNA_ID=CAMNT_0004093977 /DNA_START=34 /DNA_END=363 /DNA_ORIENTATION=+
MRTYRETGSSTTKIFIVLFVAGLLAPIVMAMVLAVRLDRQKTFHGACQEELNPWESSSPIRMLLDPGQSGGMNELLARYTDRPTHCTIQGGRLLCEIDEQKAMWVQASL